MASSRLPEELVISEILTRLPVKSIIRFRCVCKKWESLTTNPRFISKHLKNKSGNSVNWNDDGKGVPTVNEFPNGIYDLLPMDLNFGFKEKPHSIFGYCDGIFGLCWMTTSDILDGEDNELPTIALCNPATREFRILPMSNFDSPPYKLADCCNLGFGFDPKTEDYMVVKLVNFADEYSRVNCAEVYTLRTDSWRILDNVVQDVNIFRYMPKSTYCNGAIHWSLSKYNREAEVVRDSVIVSFDLSNEVFRVTSLPQKYCAMSTIRHNRRKEHIISSFHDQLAIICSIICRSRTLIRVWVLKDFEVEDPWSHVSAADLQSHPYRALGFWRNDELLIVRVRGIYAAQGQACVYDPATKQVRDLQLSGEVDFIYKETLVPVKRAVE